MSPPSPATAGRTRVSISSLIVSTVSESSAWKNSSSDAAAAPESTGAPERKNSVTTPSTAGLSWLHSPSFLVTEMKSGAKNTPPTPGNLHQRLGERRSLRLGGVARLESAGFEHRAARQEFERRRVGRRLGLDEQRRLLEKGVRRDPLDKRGGAPAQVRPPGSADGFARTFAIR